MGEKRSKKTKESKGSKSKSKDAPLWTVQADPARQVQGTYHAATSSTPRGMPNSPGRFNVRPDGRVIPHSQLTNEHQLISEQLYETQLTIPKRVVREEVLEKVIIVPEKIQYEDVVEDFMKVREKVIEVSKPVYHEKIVEVPQIEYVEKIVEVPETIVQEVIRQVPRVEVVERVKRVPKIIVQEKIVEVPEYEYREVPFEKIVEVPEIHEETVVREVLVTKTVEVQVPEYRTIEVEQKVDRYIPVAVEAITYHEFRLPKMTAKYVRTPYSVYAPRFIEVPIPTTAIDESQMADVTFVHENVKALCANPCPNLCELEKLAEYAKTRNYDFQLDESVLRKRFVQGEL